MSGQGIERKRGFGVVAVGKSQNALAFANRAHGHVEEAFLVFEAATSTALRQIQSYGTGRSFKLDLQGGGKFLAPALLVKIYC